MRESLRNSWNDAPRGIDPSVTTISVDRPRRTSPDLGSESFLTEASLIEDEPAPPSILSGKQATDGRIMHRMPMVLKDLDHAKFQRAGNALRKTVKAEPTERPGNKAPQDGVIDKRVRELQLVQGKRDVRPLKDFLPLPMRVAGVDEVADDKAGEGGVDELGVEDISVAEFTHVDPTEGREEEQSMENGVEEAPRIFLEGVEVANNSPKRGEKEGEVVLSKRQVRLRRILADKERYRALYDIIPEVSGFAGALFPTLILELASLML